MLIFAPDATDVAPEILTALSGIPTMRGYASPPTAMSFGATALAGPPSGGNHVMSSSGAARTLVGANGKVYEFGSASWTERGTFAGSVFFIPFGTDVFAIGYSTKPHTVAGSLTGITAPRAKCGDSAGYFVMLGATIDTSTGLSTSFGDQTNRWWCSAYGNATSAWEPSVTTQCASGLLADSAGGITAVRALGDRFVFYKPGAVYVATYIGPPEVFGFQKISDRIGAPSQPAIVKVDQAHYFIGSENIWRFDGSAIVPIGDAIKEWFFGSDRVSGSLDLANSASIQGRHDPFNRLIYWHYPAAGGTGALTKTLALHYPTGRFGAFDFTVTQVFATEGGVLFATTVDGDARQLSAAYLDASYVLKSLSADGSAITMTTGWYGDEFVTSLCSRLKPKFRSAPSGGTCVPSNCMHIGGTVTTGSAQNISSGFFDILQSARYHRFALSLTGDVEIEAIRPQMSQDGEE